MGQNNGNPNLVCEKGIFYNFKMVYIYARTIENAFIIFRQCFYNSAERGDLPHTLVT